MVKKRSETVPRLEFRYSWVYDQENKLKFTDPLYPSGEKIREYIEEVREDWKRISRSVLKSISRISGLSWQEESLVCYVVGRTLPISDPLSLPIYENSTDQFIEKMTYQLCERNIMHPLSLKKIEGFWDSLFHSLADDGVKVAYMVPVNAVFREIATKRFSSSGMFQSSLLGTNLDYKRAWEIVENIGHKAIIERLRRGAWD